MRQILDFVDPDILISTSSPKTERALFEISAKRNIKSLSLVDLFALDSIWYNQYYCSKYCVISEKVKSEIFKSS